MNTSTITKAKEIALRVQGKLRDKKDYPYMALLKKQQSEQTTEQQ